MSHGVRSAGSSPAGRSSVPSSRFEPSVDAERPSRPRWLTVALLVSAVSFLAVFQFLTVPRPPQPIRVERISWVPAESKGFLPGDQTKRLSFQKLLGSRTGAVFDPEYSPEHSRYLVSEPLRLLGGRVGLDIAGRFLDAHRPPARVDVIDEAGKTLASTLLPLRRRPPVLETWQTYHVDYPPAAAASGPLRLRLFIPPRPGQDDALAVRGRGVFLPSPGLQEEVYERFERAPWQRTVLASLAVAAALVLLLPLLFEAAASRNVPMLAVLLFLLSAALHFRASAYFHWDEWQVLDRFRTLGLPGVIYRHNEHFLPIFFAIYYFEAKLFGDCYALYQLFSIAIHSVNSLLVLLILERVLPGSTIARVAAVLLGAGYAVSALHSESLHWAFEACLLLSETMTFVAILFVLTRTRQDFGTLRSAAVLAIPAALAPLLFANGFVLPFVVGVFAIYTADVRFLRSEPGRSIRHYFPALFPLAGALAGVAVAAVCYALHREGAGHGVEQAGILGNPVESLKYLLVGTEAGTVLRGLGLYPYLGLEISAHVPSVLLFPRLRPEILLGLLGCFVSLLILAASRPRENWRPWVLGQSYLMLLFVLPALGRWSFGLNQAFALRYHSQTLLGLLILLLPLALRLWRWPLLCVSLLWLSVQAGMGLELRFFADLGREVRRMDLEARAGGTGDLAPSGPDPITPAMSLERVQGLIDWLRGSAKPS